MDPLMKGPGDKITEDLPPLDRSEFPAISENSLTCRAAWPFGTSSIIVDFDAETIHFTRCFTPQTFLAVQKKYWVCPLSDILSVEQRPTRDPRYQSLRIVTKTGKAWFFSTDTNFEVLSQYLLQRFPRPPVSKMARALRVILLILVVIPAFAIAIFQIWSGVRFAWLFPVILILVLVSERLRRRSAARAMENKVSGKRDGQES